MPDSQNRTRVGDSGPKKPGAQGKDLQDSIPPLLVAAVYVAACLAYFHVLPIWDGFAFFRHCYMSYAESGSTECFGHSAILNTVLFGMTQRLLYGNQQAVYALNVLLGLAGLAAFTILARHLFERRLSGVETALVSGCLILNPVFLLHVVQPCLDYALAVYVIFLLLSLAKGWYNAAAMAGYLLVLTKDNGIMLYGVPVFSYIAVRCARSPGRGLRPALRAAYPLAYPVVLFAAYMSLYPPHQHQSLSWLDVAGRMLSFDPASIIFREQLMSLYVLNFSWALTAVILLALAMRLRRVPSSAAALSAALNDRTFLYASALLMTYFNTRIELANNPRYMLPILPVVVLVFADSALTLFPRRRARIIALSIICILVFLSAFRTIDPVSKAAFGTFSFGSHEILRMEEGGWGNSIYGLDQLAYNYEFTEIGSLMEKTVGRLGQDRTYALSQIFTFNGFEDFCVFDKETGRRTANPGRSTNVSCVTDYWGAADFYLVKYPHFEYNLEPNIIKDYTPAEEMVIEEDGYSINVTRYTLNPGISHPGGKLAKKTGQL
jgi:hypothetical protein